MHPLEAQILDLVRRESLVPFGARIVIGVSGGADSVALLSVLSSISDKHGIELIAVYIDHGLRPDETQQEKEHVAFLAAHMQVEFASRAVPVKEHARIRKLSLEHAARDLRYQALREVAAARKAFCIATAHTADDQAEEILIRLLRGSGRKGISGMQMQRGDIVRPFLKTEKHTVLAYLDDMDRQFLEDSSNSDPRFLRNRVRHELIPYLEDKFDPGIKQALRKTAVNLAEDEKLLEELTGKALNEILYRAEDSQTDSDRRLSLDRKLFLQQPGTLQRRVVEKLLWQIGGRAHYTHIVQVIEAAQNGRTGSELHLSKGLRVGVQREYLEFVYPEGQRAWRGRLYPE